MNMDLVIDRGYGKEEKFSGFIYTDNNMFSHEYATILSPHLLNSIDMIYVCYIVEVGMGECL